MKNLLNEVDKYIELREKKKLDNEVMTSHRASHYCKCKRELYFMWTKEPITDYPTATDIYRMAVGTWIHSGFQEILTEMYGDDVIHEHDFTVIVEGLKYPITGHLDSKFLSDNSGAELKTTFGRGIVNISRTQKPMDHHLEQICVYIVFDNVAEFSLPYLGRDSFYRTDFNISLTDEQKNVLREKIIEKFKQVEYAVETKTIPDRDYQAIVFDGEIRKEKQHKNVKYKSDWQCQYCYYRSRCYADEIADFGLHLPTKINNEED